MISLGVVEGPRRGNFGGDRPVPSAGQLGLIHLLGALRGPGLCITVGEDRGAVLRAYIVALPHALSRVVALPEHPQQGVERYVIGPEDDQDHLGVARSSRAHLLVGWVRGGPARVPNRGRVYAGGLPELPLRTPEATHADDEGLRACGERRLNPIPVDEVHLGNIRKRIRATG